MTLGTVTPKPSSTPDWINPFLAPGAPYITGMVLYHHPDEASGVPAIICAIRGKDTTGVVIHPHTHPVHIQDVDLSNVGPILLEARLAILRPGVVEWRWSAQGPGLHAWSWPRLPEWVKAGGGVSGDVG